MHHIFKTSIYFKALIGEVFDAAWALASAMHETEEELKMTDSSLDYFTYSDTHTTKTLFKNIKKQSFYGQSVSDFNKCCTDIDHSLNVNMVRLVMMKFHQSLFLSDQTIVTNK